MIIDNNQTTQQIDIVARNRALSDCTCAYQLTVIPPGDSDQRLTHLSQMFLPTRISGTGSFLMLWV